MKSPQLIKDWLAERGSTQTWLAKQVPCNRANLNCWLSGRTMPNAAARATLARVTGLDVADKAAWEKGDVE